MPVGWYVIEPPFTATISSSLKHPRATLGGAVLVDAILDADLHILAAALAGTAPILGPMSGTLAKTVATLTGGQAMFGTEASVMARVAFAGTDAALVFGTGASTLRKAVASLTGTEGYDAILSSTLRKSAASLTGTHTANPAGTLAAAARKLAMAASGTQVTLTGTVASTLKKATASFTGSQTVRPDEFYFTAVGKTVQDINTGFTTDSGHKLISIRAGGAAGDELKVRDSAFDGARVITTDSVSTSGISLYLVGVAAASGGPPTTTPVFADPVVYQAFRYRELSYGAFTTNGDPTDTCLMITFNSTDSATADSGNHIKSYYGKIVATTITNGGSETAEGTFSGLTDPGNGWRTVEFAMNRNTGLCIIKDWNGVYHTYTDSLIIDPQAKYPLFEWYVSNYANRHRYEIQEMWASTLAVMDTPRVTYFNKLFTDNGETPPAPPAPIVAGTPLVDLFNRADTATGDDTALGVNYVRSGLLPMYIYSNSAQAGSYNNMGCANSRTDYVFGSDNQRVSCVNKSAGSAAGWPIMPHVRASAAGQAIFAYFANGSPATFYNSTTSHAQNGATARGTGSPVNPDQTTMGAGTVWSLEAIGPLGNSFYIMRKDGVLWHSWWDTSSLYTGIGSGNRVPVVSSYSNTAGTGQIDSITWEDLGANAFLATQMTKSGTQGWATSATWADISTWTAVNTATSGVPTYTTILGTNSLTIIGAKTGASFAASVPYTASTAGLTHKIRIVRVSDSAVIATSTPDVTTTSGTVTLNATANVVSGEQYKLQMQGTTTGNGTITATTTTFTIS